jgi:hypothetical protein
MALVDDCTPAMLYVKLEELGINVARLRKTRPTFARLEAMYYRKLDEKLIDVFHKKTPNWESL